MCRPIVVEERRGASGQCYSDIADLLRTEQLADGRLPYLERCDVAAKPCDEYPLVSMYVMRLTASWPGGGDPYTTFFWVNAVLLLACALVITWCLERLGAATALFAVAPTLLIYGTMNWDLVPVTFATVATFAFLKRREVASGVLLGIGAAAKLYPALLVLPFAADRWRTDERGRGVKLVLAAAISWLALNLPFALAAPEGWFRFVRYHSERPAEYDSLWRVACENGLCLTTGAINIASLILFAVGSAFVWRVKERRDPGGPGVDLRIRPGRDVPVDEQGVVAAVRAVAPSVVRIGGALVQALPRVPSGRGAGVRREVLLLPTPGGRRGPAVRSAGDRGRCPSVGAGLVPRGVGAGR